MEEQREESVLIGDCKVFLEEIGKELGLVFKFEILDGEVDVLVKELCVEDDVEKGVSFEFDDVVKIDEFDIERDVVDVKLVNGGGSYESVGEEGNEVIDEEVNYVVE